MGANIPFGATAEALHAGVPVMVRFGYPIEREWGSLTIGLLGGLQYQGTRVDARYGYHLLSAPLGAEIRYATRWSSPWYLTVGAAGGAAFNYVAYKETHPYREDLLNVSPFVSPSVGVGRRLSPRLSLELDTRLWVVLYSGTSYLGLVPALGVKMAL